MPTAKRYYWLKLQEDFFSSKRIKKLRKIAGGDTYTIIYLKMQLLAMKNDGILEYTGLEQTFAEELALDLDEDPANVSVTVSYLLNCGLLETADNKEFFVPYAVLNTGSEGASAKRMRDHRSRKALQCDTHVTPMLQNGDGEKEIEKELEIENREREEREEEPADKPPAPPPDRSIESDISGFYAPDEDGVNMTIVHYSQIKNLYNTLCPSFPRCKFLSDSRKKAIKARFSSGRTLKDFETLFAKAEASSFLKGRNDRNWIASFDWLIKDANMAKVLDGNYDDHKGGGPGAADTGNHSGQYGTWL